MGPLSTVSLLPPPVRGIPDHSHVLCYFPVCDVWNCNVRKLVWTPASADPPAPLKVHSDAVSTTTLSPNEKTIVSTPVGPLISQSQSVKPVRSARYAIWCPVTTPSVPDRVMYVTGNDTVYRVDLADKTISRCWVGPDPYAIVACPISGWLLVSCHSQGVIAVDPRGWMPPDKYAFPAVSSKQQPAWSREPYAWSVISATYHEEPSVPIRNKTYPRWRLKPLFGDAYYDDLEPSQARPNAPGDTESESAIRPKHLQAACIALVDSVALHDGYDSKHSGVGTPIASMIGGDASASASATAAQPFVSRMSRVLLVITDDTNSEIHAATVTLPTLPP